MSDSRTHTSPSAETATELKLEGVWRVVVLNDPVNLMSYVVLVFKKVFGFDEQRAHFSIIAGRRPWLWCSTNSSARPVARSGALAVTRGAPCTGPCCARTPHVAADLN